MGRLIAGSMLKCVVFGSLGHFRPFQPACTPPTWLLLQRWLAGTVLAGLALRMAFEAKRA
jgi:hypothetical protein